MTKIPVDPATIRVLDGSTVWSDVTYPGWEKGSKFTVRNQYTRWQGKWQQNDGGGRRDDPPELGSPEFVWGKKRKVSPHGPYTIWDYGGPDQLEYFTYNSADGTTRWAAVPATPPKMPGPELVIDRKWVHLEYSWADTVVECRCCGESFGHRRLVEDYVMESDERLLIRRCPACFIEECCELYFREPEDWMVKAAVEEDFRNGRSDGLRA